MIDKNTYDLFTGEELKIAEKIQQRRYQILVHSCIYYHMGQNIISDYEWDEWARELRDLQNQYPEISKQVTLYEYFKDWDAYTGFHLPITLDWVIEKAERLLDRNMYKTLSIAKPVSKPVRSRSVKTKNSGKKKLF